MGFLNCTVLSDRPSLCIFDPLIFSRSHYEYEVYYIDKLVKSSSSMGLTSCSRCLPSTPTTTHPNFMYFSSEAEVRSLLSALTLSTRLSSQSLQMVFIFSSIFTCLCQCKYCSRPDRGWRWQAGPPPRRHLRSPWAPRGRRSGGSAGAPARPGRPPRLTSSLSSRSNLTDLFLMNSAVQLRCWNSQELL